MADTNYIVFESGEDAEAWRNQNHQLLARLHEEVASIEGVAYTETWLCGACPSYIAGCGDDDHILVCLPIRQIQERKHLGNVRPVPWHRDGL